MSNGIGAGGGNVAPRSYVKDFGFYSSGIGSH